MFRTIFLFFVLITSTTFANYDQHNNFADWVIQHAEKAVKHVEQDKIYLHSSKVYLSEENIFLIIDCDEMIPLPSISSSENGLYIKTNDLNIFNMWQCSVRGCGKWNSNFVNVCQWCHTPRGETGD